MVELNWQSASTLARMIRAGETTASAVMGAHLDRIAAREAEVGAFVHLDAERAMELAEAADRQPAQGLLHGVPFAIKDIIDTQDMPTQCGSDLYAHRQPERDAACVRRMLDAGAIPLGKTVTTEFAYFRPGKTANPHNLGHTPGGSSSGSAAAVADGMAPLSFGTQTSASLIRPAAFCGVCAFKPTTDTFDVSGVLPLAPSLDTLGFLARQPEDFSLAYAVMTGSPLPAPGAFTGTRPRIRLMRGPHWQEGSAEMREVVARAMRILSEQGAETGEVDHPPLFREMTDAQKAVMAYEAASTHARLYDENRAGVSDQFAELVEAGRRITAEQYRAALDTCDRAKPLAEALFADCDALLVASAPGEAPQGLGSTGDPLFSRMWTLLQLPAVALPLGTGPQGLPLGIQLIGRRNGDEALLAVAKWVHDRFAASA